MSGRCHGDNAAARVVTEQQRGMFQRACVHSFNLNQEPAEWQLKRRLRIGGAFFTSLCAKGADNYLLCLARYPATPSAVGFMASSPSCQLAGQTWSPCASTNCRASTMRRASLTLRPSGRSLMTECRMIPLVSIRNRPRRATDSLNRIPYSRAMFLFRSDTRVYWMSRMPPSSTLVFFHARWVNLESTDTPMTSVLRLLKSASFLLKARISDGQTKVKSSG